MLKDKLFVAAQTTRKSGPLVTLVAAALVVAADLTVKKF